MKIIDLNPSELIEYATNPRKNDRAVDSVAASIKQFGFLQPIVIDESKTIVAGHTRLRAAKKLDLKKVPCVIASSLTEQQIKAFRILDNRLHELAEWDEELLKLEIESIIDFDFSQFDIDFHVNDEIPIDIPEDNQEIDEMALAETNIECPQCGFAWKK